MYCWWVLHERQCRLYASIPPSLQSPPYPEGGGEHGSIVLFIDPPPLIVYNKVCEGRYCKPLAQRIVATKVFRLSHAYDDVILI